MLDKKDLEILEVVKNHAKWTTHHISKKTLIPVTTVHNRIKKLEKMGIIKGYTAILDHKKLGKAIPAFVIVDVASDNQAKRTDEILKVVERFSEVHEAYAVTGEHDLIVRISVEDTEKLNDFLVKVDGIRGVEKARTFIILHGDEDR